MRPRHRLYLLAFSVLLLLAVPLLSSVLYIVNERELAVVLQFGDPVAARTEPGLYTKLPLIQEVRRLPKTYQYWEGSSPEEKLVDVTTRDSKKIEATMWAVWRITDPVAFVRTLRTEEAAETRVKEFVRSTARDVLTKNRLAEIVRSTNRRMSLTLGLPEAALEGADQEAIEAAISQVMAPEARQPITEGRLKLMEQIRQEAQQALAATREPVGAAEEASSSKKSQGRGIVLVDVGLSRVEFVPEVRDAAFERLIALMNAIAVKNRSEGEQRKQEIINEAGAEAEAILGEGAEKSNILRGEVEAEITEKYAQAIEESAGFYDFNRKLELYKKALVGTDTRLILGSNNDLLRLLTNPEATGLKPPSIDTPTSDGPLSELGSAEPTSSGPPAR